MASRLIAWAMETDSKHGRWRLQCLYRHVDNLVSAEHKQPYSLVALTRMAECQRVVELNAVTENRVHDLIKGHERAPKKLAVVKGGACTVGRHVNYGMAKGECQGSKHESRQVAVREVPCALAGGGVAGTRVGRGHHRGVEPR